METWLERSLRMLIGCFDEISVICRCTSSCPSSMIEVVTAASRAAFSKVGRWTLGLLSISFVSSSSNSIRWSMSTSIMCWRVTMADRSASLYTYSSSSRNVRMNSRYLTRLTLLELGPPPPPSWVLSPQNIPPSSPPVAILSWRPRPRVLLAALWAGGGLMKGWVAKHINAPCGRGSTGRCRASRPRGAHDVLLQRRAA